MAKHDAVDQLMALATQKRADRVADGAPPARTAAEPAVFPAHPEAVPVPTVSEASAQQQGSTAAAKGRQFLESVRPLLPAVAGAMRLVDHGAVQALARLLPLLGGPGGPSVSPKAVAAQEQGLRSLADLEATQQASRRDVAALQLQLAASEELLARTRTQVERLFNEQALRESEHRALGNRVRLLSAGLIILLMLIVAQMILLLVMLHR